jgi:Family of unknown function (DUF6220)
MTAGRSARHHPTMAQAVRDIGRVRLGFVVAAWLFVACVVVQVFLVGLDVFAKMGGSIHRDFAYVYGWLAPILVLLAAVARVPRPLRTLTWVLLVLFAFQTVLPSLKDQFPLLAAFHTINALAIFGIGMTLARRSTEWVRQETVPDPDPR